MATTVDDKTLTQLERLLKANWKHGPFTWDGTVLRDRHGGTVLTRHGAYGEDFLARFAAVVEKWNNDFEVIS